MATADLQNIIDAIIVVQKTVSTPSGQKAIQAYYDEPPAALGKISPVFVNVEEGIEAIDVWVSQGRNIDYIINMHLLFTPGEQKYSVRARRTWVLPVINAFGAKTQLDGSISELKIARIRAVDFDPILFGSTEYPAITFELAVRMEGAFAWGI